MTVISEFNEYATGVCLGASTVSLVVLKCKPDSKNKRPEIYKVKAVLHEGHPRKTLVEILSELDVEHRKKIAVTGRKFTQFVNLTTICEPESVEAAFAYVKPDRTPCPAVVSAGGETFMVYVMDDAGNIADVITGNKCASGTGEFFLQQLRRMDVSMEEASRWGVSDVFHSVSGRCSVFCKSDCTHALNKGIPKPKVAAGLCRMMADKILELLKKIEKKNVMLTGGAARNKMMVHFLKEKIPGLTIPKEAPYFEALGAALWARNNPTREFPEISLLIEKQQSSFDTLPALETFRDNVAFKTGKRAKIEEGDVCLLGLDVGSTTTKAVLTRESDDAILASIYLRTNGDPIAASRNCYKKLLEQVREQIDPRGIAIKGLGVTGSGRQIAGLHGMTDGVVNEIIAHATAAVYFDPQVDTILEIGGQDAKYTYITNGVPSDYAMNEACSAGTGSFLEEAALESMGIKVESISQLALEGRFPPNFSDQCAAFISSDIKTAIHEGLTRKDILAGLVYAICMNYVNRVKGPRPVGRKVFMQGGVCYNQAVPLAMSGLLDKPVVTPPDPGLMGAFGVALEIKKRMGAGLLRESAFDLGQLADREVDYGKSFTCRGAGNHCDRRCEVSVIIVDGKKYPFGGACNRYENIRRNIKFDSRGLDKVRTRQNLVFAYSESEEAPAEEKWKGVVGISRSFLTNTYYPLYDSFFKRLGFGTVLSEEPSREGIDLKNAPFCYPGELAHGFFHSLAKDNPDLDYIFTPHFKAVEAQAGFVDSQVCPLVQGEPFYLKSTFKNLLENRAKPLKLLSPLLDFTRGLKSSRPAFLQTAAEMGVSEREASKAFDKALAVQEECSSKMRAMGRKVLAELESDPEKIAVVVFGRAYNAFPGEANMGIPHKFATRGLTVVPFDCLPFEPMESREHMYWGTGQRIVKAARLVERHPGLFGVYITNFSCGPDSFIITYFRDIMGKKPSLTLELDSHTADAGIETRIEAFLDIVTAYRQQHAHLPATPTSNSFRPARLLRKNGRIIVETSSGRLVPFTDPNVTLLIPSMGKIFSEAMAAVFRSEGVNAKSAPPANNTDLKTGRGYTSCKECLPLILTTGSLIEYVRREKRDDEILVYFMATGSGPCRFGQYYSFFGDLIRKQQLRDVALYSISSENAYAGMGSGFERKAWRGVVASDAMEDIRSMLLANAKNPDEAMEIFDRCWGRMIAAFEQHSFAPLRKALSDAVSDFRKIPLKKPPEEVPVVALVGEIFVRRDGLSRQHITETLAGEGFAVTCSPIGEWVLYTDYLVNKGLASEIPTLMEKLRLFVKQKYMAHSESSIKSILAQSGLVRASRVDVEAIVDAARSLISPSLAGEAILTVGSALMEISSHACGVIGIGPFGCMPNRLSEAILSDNMNVRAIAENLGPAALSQHALIGDGPLPFLVIESDGSPFTQLLRAKLDAFCLSARRLHARKMAFHSDRNTPN